MRTITKRVLTLAAATTVSAGLALGGLPASAAPASPSALSMSAQVAAEENGEGEVESIAEGHATIKLRTGVRVKLRLAACIVIGGPLVEGVHVRLGINLLGIRILVVL